MVFVTLLSGQAPARTARLKVGVAVVCAAFSSPLWIPSMMARV